MWPAFARTHYERLNARYASDVTDDEYALIEPLPPARRGGRRRTTDLREVLNAILYLVRTGCQWRLLPKEFPPWSTVYGYFRRFWAEGIWHRIWMILLMSRSAGAKLRRSGMAGPTFAALRLQVGMQTREQAGKAGSPTAGVVDSQSVKTTESGGLRGYDVPVCRSEAPKIRHDGSDLRRAAAAGGDAGKKINGRKRHLVTDTLGLPLKIVVHAANIQDRDGSARACHWIKRQFPWLVCLFADAGYQGPIASSNAAGAGLKLEIVPRRWVIERTFGRLGRNRRLAKDFERPIETSTNMVVVAIIQLLVRGLANA